MKCRHLAPMTLHNKRLLYVSHLAKHKHCWTWARVWTKTERKGKKNREKEIWSVHLQRCRCICPVGVYLQLLTPLSTQSLGIVCVSFCVWLWARGMGMCVNMCVAESPMRKLINTLSALTPALCVCVCGVCLHTHPHYTLFTNPPGHVTCARSEAFVSSSF